MILTSLFIIKIVIYKKACLSRNFFADHKSFGRYRIYYPSKYYWTMYISECTFKNIFKIDCDKSFEVNVLQTETTSVRYFGFNICTIVLRGKMAHSFPSFYKIDFTWYNKVSLFMKYFVKNGIHSKYIVFILSSILHYGTSGIIVNSANNDLRDKEWIENFTTRWNNKEINYTQYPHLAFL